MDKNKRTIIIVCVIVVVVIIFAIVKSRSGLFSMNQTGVSSTNGIAHDASGKIVQPAFNANLNSVNFSAPVSSQSSAGITAADKKAVYEGLLAGFKIMTSGDVKAIRSYLLAKASTPAEKNFVNVMSDADVANLSSRLAVTMVMPLPENLLSPTAVWIRNGSTMTIEYLDPTSGTTTKRAVFINGSWY